MKYILTGTLVLFIVSQCDMKIQYNTYPEQISRVTEYDPRVVRKSCLLKPDSGPCRANIQMYHFVPKEGKCDKFYWGGCQGNGNRFDSEAECTDVCLSKPDEKPKQPRYCSLSFDYGFCFGAVSRWYYDHLWKVCKETIYSGCGGNKNNFYNIEQCEAVCRFGIGRIPSADRKENGKKKVIIINPWNTTPARGKDQTNSNKTTST